MTVPPDIFLSYNREDQAVAKRFAEGFEAAGLSVWWDVTLRSGEAYDAVTEEALKIAKAVVVLWSEKSVVSRWVRAEATLADRNRTLVPARIEPCDLPIMFELTQTADLSHWQGEAGDAAWRAFLGDVQRMAGASAAQGKLPVTSKSRPVRGAKPSIALLPFINRSGVPGDDVFADGMVEDLSAALSLSRRLKVIAASATAAYRTGARDLKQIGRDLGVRYLLEGNVRRVGGDFRVTAQLVEADDGDILWTQKFDRPLTEIGSLQEDLVVEVAACLGAEVHRSEIEHALRKPDEITAWEAMLRAEAHLARGTPGGTQDAAVEARRAIAIDPGYDLAHATLAMALAFHYVLRGSKDRILADEANRAITRACETEPEHAVALARIAAALNFMGRIEEALPFAERAVGINPNYETPHIALGNIYLELGREEEASRQFDAAESVAPNGIWSAGVLNSRARAHFVAERYVEALALVERSLHLRNAVVSQILIVLCLAECSRGEQASQALRRMRVADPGLTWADVENAVRRYYCGGLEPARIARHVASVRTLWDEVERKA